MKIRLCRPSRDPPKFQGCRWHGRRIECYGPMTAEGAATRKHTTSEPLDVPPPPDRLALPWPWSSARVWPTRCARPRSPKRSTTPRGCCPSSPPRCTVQQVDSGNVAGCIVTFYDEPAATGWGIAPRAGRRRGMDLERLLVQRLAGTGQLGVDLHRRQQPAGRRPRGGHVADPRRRPGPVRGLPRRDRRQRLPRPRRAAATPSAARAATADGTARAATRPICPITPGAWRST